MKNKIIIDNSFGYSRIAVLQDEKLVEGYIEKQDDKRLNGSIFVGRVMNLLKGTDGAFLDIGLKEMVYLDIEDIPERSEGASIKDVLHIGQELPVQIIKQEQTMKNPKATANIMLPGKFLILTPVKKYIGISSKIGNKDKRKELSFILQAVLEKDKELTYGVIARTAAAGAGIEDIKKDLEQLIKLWEVINSRAPYIKAPAILYQDSIVDKVIRDKFSTTEDEIIVKDQKDYDYFVELIKRDMPQLKDGLILSTNKRSLFDYYSINSSFEKLSERKVWLKSGAFIIFDSTEAMTVIDVNTGKNMGKKDSEETILNVNIEAAAEIARQLRLRDIGGIILVDFINQKSEKNKKKLLSEFEKFTKIDNSRVFILGMTKLGLVEVTRRKIGNSIYDMNYRQCPKCSGSGKVINYGYVMLKIYDNLIDFIVLMKAQKTKLALGSEIYGHIAERCTDQFDFLQKEYSCDIVVQKDLALKGHEYKISHDK